MRNIVKKIESMVQGKRPGDQEEAAPHPLLKMESSLSLDDEPPPGQPDERRKKDQLLKSSESIQRAIKDIYRTAKLLHNFSIMNYTGFVKIGACRPPPSRSGASVRRPRAPRASPRLD